MREAKSHRDESRGAARWVVGALTLGVVIWLAVHVARRPLSPVVPKRMDVVAVHLPVPSPRPPEPPQVKEVPRPSQEFVDQPPVEAEETKDEPEPAAPISTGIKGDGSADGFGVGASGGPRLGGGGMSGRQGKWGGYAGQVQGVISAALRQKPEIRSASFNFKVRIWADAAGRVVQAKLDPPDSGEQQVIYSALLGLQLREAPPEGMPMPIILSVTMKKAER